MRALFLLALAACGSGDDGTGPGPADAGSGRDAAPHDSGADAAPSRDAGADAAVVDEDSLELRFLGVQGWVIRTGGDAVLTAPMFTNPDLTTVTVGTVASDPAIVDRFTEGVSFDDVRAIVTGHGHYDHLMDAPPVWAKTPGATFYGNQTVAHILAAFAPDRAPGCEASPAPAIQIPRELVVALAEDRRNCDGPDADPGRWERVPGAPLRVRAFCSSHPAQFLGIHFGEGSVDEDLCEPPTRGADWKEGTTISLLVDFLDPETDTPRFRIFYQDAPTDAPVGHVPEDVLAEKRVDVAILCVGNFNEVGDHPTEILDSLQPRYAVSGHWESFFQTQDQPLTPLPLHDLDLYRSRAEAVLSEPEAPATVDGASVEARHFIPDPGTVFVLPRE